jgi:hypothetical protein
MRRGLQILVGLALLPCLAALAAGTQLNVTCITKDLPAGARVWLRVEPEPYRAAMPNLASLGEASGPAAPASGVWTRQFEVPAGGSVPASTHGFTFPTDLQPTNANSVSSIRLKVSFKVDAPGVQGAYGEVLRSDFGMPVRAANGPLSRCLRLRGAGDKLILESAPECTEASFANAGHNGRILLRPTQ